LHHVLAAHVPDTVKYTGEASTTSGEFLINAVDITQVLNDLDREQYVITPQTLATLSPYVTKHLQHFGDFLIDMDTLPYLPSLEPISLTSTDWLGGIYRVCRNYPYYRRFSQRCCNLTAYEIMSTNQSNSS